MTIRFSALHKVHVATILFGLVGIFAVSTGLGPIAITFGRTFFAALALLVVLVATRRTSGVQFDTRSLISGALLAVHWCLFFKSIQVSSVAIGLIMFSVSAVFISLLEPWYFQKERRRVDFYAAVVVVVGIVIIVGVGDVGRDTMSGVGYGLLSSFIFAVLQLLNRELAKSKSVVGLSFVQNAVACTMLLPLVYYELPGVLPWQWLQLVFLGCVCTAFAHTLFIDALRRVNAALAGLIAAGLEPVYGAALAAVLLSQYPSFNVVVGGIIVVAAVLWASHNNTLSKNNCR